MIAAWMLYLLIVSGLLSIAGLSAEKAARWLHRPVRSVWAATLFGTPLFAFVVARTGGLSLFGGAAASNPGPAGLTASSAAGPTSALAAAWDTIQSSARTLDRPLLILWIAASTAVLLALLISMRRLYVASRKWPRRRVDGNEVRVSEGLGPAVLGFGRAEVVLPSWVLEQDPASRRLIVLHEAEHVKARDGALLFAGLLVAAAIPWNPLAWWQLRRLRLAVELDCDRRVLRSGVELREYASLLLEAGSRRAVPFGSAAAFVHFDSQLGRRIRMMMENRNAPRYVPAAVALAMAAAILVVACSAPTPTETSDIVVSEQAAPGVVAGKIVQKLHEGGTWTAHLEREGELEAVEFEFGENQEFVFKSGEGTLDLLEEGELRKISKVELNGMLGAGEKGEFRLRQLAVPERGHLELDESSGDWTLDESDAYKLRQIKESQANQELGEEGVHLRTDRSVQFGP